MKNLLVFLFLSLTFLINAQDFDITNFKVDLEVNADGSYNVIETIDVFFKDEKRGIFREIENTYTINNGTVKIGINNIAVAGHDYNVNNKKDKVIIKIGNPDVYLKGKQQFIISYIIDKGIITYPDHLEFHYDITGNSWNVPIDDVEFTIKLPKSITLSADDIKVTGGRKNENLNIAELRQTDSRTLQGRSLRRIGKKNGITAAIRLPEKYLDVANNQVTYFEQEKKKESSKPFYILIPLALFGWLFSFWKKMRKTDYIGDSNEIVMYPPNGLTSAHIGGFIDQTSNARDIVSLLPYWAGEGYIEMKQIVEEIYLYKIKNLPPDFPEYEHLIFNKLFSKKDVAKISDLKSKMNSTVFKAQSLLTKEIKQQDYYHPGYVKIFKSWRRWLFPIFMILFGLFSFFYLQLYILGLGCFIAAIAAIFLSVLGIPLTEKGAKLESEIKSFKKFLKDPDRNLLEKVIQEDPSYFDKMFPFAIAFGIENTFLDKLETHMAKAPYWYHSDQENHSFSTFRDGFKPEVIQSAFSTPSHDSGNGSGHGGSGGGFSSGSGVGGGGGGSW